jgi:uncharacterized damage-inducible protein DinB
MHTELSNFREHSDRYRAVTLLTLDTAPDDAALDWRPTPEAFTLGQHLVHIAQAEDYYTHGLFDGEWRKELIRLDRAPCGRAAIRAYFDDVRARWTAKLDELTEHDLGSGRDSPDAPPGITLRWWLWFILEHEIHHKAQAAVYLRLMGLTAPFYAMPMGVGVRPDFRDGV